MDLRDLIEREIEQHLEWPTADKSHVTTVSAKLFAEHVARLYADHIPDAGKMISDQLRDGTKRIGRPQIREVFLRNGAVADSDDMPDYVYESVFELLELAAPAVQGEPVARVKTIGGYPDDSEHTIEWLCKHKDLRHGDYLYAAQPLPDITLLVEELHQSFPLLDDKGLDEDEHHCEWSIQQERKRLHAILAAYRKGGEA